MSEMTDWPSIEPFRKLGETLCPHERDTISHGLTIHWAICPRCLSGNRRDSPRRVQENR